MLLCLSAAQPVHAGLCRAANWAACERSHEQLSPSPPKAVDLHMKGSTQAAGSDISDESCSDAGLEGVLPDSLSQAGTEELLALLDDGVNR